MAKYLYAQHREWGVQSSFSLNVYANHLEVWNGFHEKRPPKEGLEDYVVAFDTLLDSLKEEGFLQKISLIPVDISHRIVNGSHRIAGCLLHDVPVATIVRHQETCVDSSIDWLVQRGLEEKYGDAMAIQYCRLKNNTCMMYLPEMGEQERRKIRHLLLKFGTPVYTKLLKDDLPHPWPATDDKYAILYEPKNAEAMKTVLQHISSLLPHDVYLSPTGDGALLQAQIFFNANTLHWLTNKRNSHDTAFAAQLKNYKEWLQKQPYPAEWFCVAGDAVLAAYGIKEAPTWEFLFHGTYPYENEILRCQNKDLPPEVVDEFIFNPDNYFWCDGVKFLSINCYERSSS